MHRHRPWHCWLHYDYEVSETVSSYLHAANKFDYRVNALYQGSTRVRIALVSLWVGMLGVYIWLIIGGHRMSLSVSRLICLTSILFTAVPRSHGVHGEFETS